MAEVLAAEDVRKRYGETVALDGVSLSIGPGETFGLIGPNGAGKTTLVRALTGTVAVEGRVRAFGRPPSRADADRVGLLPQSFAPPARLTARELVGYYAGLYDDPREPATVLRDVGLADDADTWYERLSGGQRRRTCVACALVNDPDLLVLDEPTAGIDPAGRRALHALLDELAAGGTTVLLTSHAMDEIERLADRVGLLADGRLVAVGPPAELIARHGGERRLEVGLAGRGREGTGAVPDAAAGFPVERTERGLVVSGVGPTDLGAVVAALESAGIAYESLTWRRPDLEDVYMALAGGGDGTGTAAGRPGGGGRSAPEPGPATADDGGRS
jgi:ABC-2 type transport system ATP-binding protein